MRSVKLQLVNPQLQPVISEQEEDATVRSLFHCGGMCCSSEVPTIRKALKEGNHDIKEMRFNVPMKQVIVFHDTSQVSAQELEKLLNGAGFKATVIQDGGAQRLVANKKSMWCSSMFVFVQANQSSKSQGGKMGHDHEAHHHGCKDDKCQDLECQDYECEDDEAHDHQDHEAHSHHHGHNHEVHGRDHGYEGHGRQGHEAYIHQDHEARSHHHDGCNNEVHGRTHNHEVHNHDHDHEVHGQAHGHQDHEAYILQDHEAHGYNDHEAPPGHDGNDESHSHHGHDESHGHHHDHDESHCHHHGDEAHTLKDHGCQDRECHHEPKVANTAFWCDVERMNNIMKVNFDSRTELGSFSMDITKDTLMVLHNPNTLSASQIAAVLSQQEGNVKAKCVLDGGKSTKTNYYDQLKQDAKDQDSSKNAEKTERAMSYKYPRPTVIMSGILWIVSMLSLVGDEPWEHLKWVGLASVAFGLPPIAIRALRTMKRFQFDDNSLMFFASVGALALGEFAEAAAVVFLFALSEWLEVRATTRARETLKAMVNLKPDKAQLFNPENKELIEVLSSAVPVGALVAVKTGAQIPCDGIVVEGESTVDESSLTGESKPIRKGPRDIVSGGTLNSGATQLMVCTTASAENSAVSRLIRLVEEAQANRSETERIVDEFAKYYTPMVVLAALLMCTIPWAVGTDVGRQWTHNGLILIVVACPCGLIISTPVCYVAGLAATAQNGVLIKGGAYLEAVGRTTHICMDKTGTLTNGEFALLHLKPVNTDTFSKTHILQHLALMEERSSHPVASAILQRASNEGVKISAEMTVKKHTLLAGEGVTGVIDNKDVYVGNERLFERLGVLSDLPEPLKKEVESWKQLGGTIGFMSVQDLGIVCAFCAADGVRPESAVVVDHLKKRGVGITMLTGDNHDAAVALGKQVGLSVDEIKSKLLPEEKLQHIESLIEAPAVGDDRESSSVFQCRKRRKVVLFCGDGVNDAPALAAANVGIAMGAGATLAMETADITLLDSNLEKLEYSIRLGRQVINKIWQNVVFSIAVKLVVLVFAVSGNARLWAAIASDVGAMILVTLNAMMILPRTSREAEPHDSPKIKSAVPPPPNESDVFPTTLSENATSTLFEAP